MPWFHSWVMVTIKSGLYVGPGYMLSLFQISLNSGHPFERNQLTNIPTNFHTNVISVIIIPISLLQHLSPAHSIKNVIPIEIRYQLKRLPSTYLFKLRNSPLSRPDGLI